MVARTSPRSSELIQIIENEYSDDDDEKSILIDQGDCIDSPLTVLMTELIDINTEVQGLINKVDDFNKRFFQCLNFFICCFTRKFELEWRQINFDLDNRMREIHNHFREATEPLSIEHTANLFGSYFYILKHPKNPDLKAAITQYGKLRTTLSEKMRKCSLLFRAPRHDEF